MSEPHDALIDHACGNIFADLGRPEAETHHLKAELVEPIDQIIRERRLTQARTADLLGISEPDVSRPLRGNFRDHSVERLPASRPTSAATSNLPSANRAPAVMICNTAASPEHIDPEITRS